MEKWVEAFTNEGRSADRSLQGPAWLSSVFACDRKRESPLISSGARIPELDGLRGVAAVSVVIAHYFGEVPHGLPPLAFAWVGVDLFFVLSGFLIGSIILERNDSSNFLRVFYIRRALRILPIYFITIAVVLVFLHFRPSAAWMPEALPPWSYLTFTQNFLMAVSGNPGNPWLLPTWTLAVEEQFYLLAPLLIIALPARRLVPALLAGILSGVAFRALIYWNAEGSLAGHVLLPSRWDLLLCGVIAARVHSTFEVKELVLRLVPLIAVVLLLIATVCGRITGTDLFYMTRPLLMGVFFSAYVLLAAQNWALMRPLRSPKWGFFGSISYGLYLIHEPVAGILHSTILGTPPDVGSIAQVLVTVAALAISIWLAWLSWKHIEAPLVQIARRSGYVSGKSDEPRHSVQ